MTQSSPLTEHDLAEIRTRCDAATPGPWVASIEGRDHESGSSCIVRGTPSDDFPDIEMSGATEADWDFIAHARQDLPRLLREIERLREELRRATSAA